MFGFRVFLDRLCGRNPAFNWYPTAHQFPFPIAVFTASSRFVAMACREVLPPMVKDQPLPSPPLFFCLATQMERVLILVPPGEGA